MVAVTTLKLALKSGSTELLRLLLDESVITGVSGSRRTLMTCPSTIINQFGRLLLRSSTLNDAALPLATELFRTACTHSYRCCAE
jgi:hypothetical protein